MQPSADIARYTLGLRGQRPLSTTPSYRAKADRKRMRLKGLSAAVKGGLLAVGVEVPSRVQRAAVPAILAGRDIFVAAETVSAIRIVNDSVI